MTCSTEDRRLGWLLTIGGVVGLTAAVVLLVEKIALLKDPTYIPTCSINPVLSCGSVMTTPVAEAFGIPNPIIGIVGFSAVVMYGAALLAGGQFQRWLWVCLQVGVTFGVVFVHWLIYQSLHVIGALCPYCMVVWAVMIPIFWFTTVHVLGGSRRALRNATPLVLTVWFLGIIGLVAVRFWDYWTTLI